MSAVVTTTMISRPTISPRSYSVPTSSRPVPLPPSGLNKRPKSLLSRFRRFSQYDVPPGSSSSSSGSGSSSRDAIIGDDQIPTLERMARDNSLRERQKLKHGLEKAKDEEDIDWEKVKTLPRVCLTPPDEDNGQTVTLYPLLPPAPRYIDIRSRPTSITCTLTEDDTTSVRTAGSTGVGGETSIWAGMAPGFILPPPVFSRKGQPVRGGRGKMAVVMPKKRSEVVAERTRRLAREAIDGPDPDHDLDQRKSSIAESEATVPIPIEAVAQQEEGEGEGEEEEEEEEGEEEDQLELDEEDEREIIRACPTTPPGSLALVPDDMASTTMLMCEMDGSVEQEVKEDLREVTTVALLIAAKPRVKDINDEINSDESGNAESDVVADLLDEDVAQFQTAVHVPSITLVQQAESVKCDSPTSYPDESYCNTDSPSTSIEPDDSASQHHASPVAVLRVEHVDDQHSDQTVDEAEAPAEYASKATAHPTEAPLPPFNDQVPDAPAIETNTRPGPPALTSPAPLVFLPPTPRPGLRKQKSLKQLLSFGFPLSSTPPPPLPEYRPLSLSTQPIQGISEEEPPEPLIPRKRLGLLSRQSKPSLRVDMKPPKAERGNKEKGKENEPISAPTPTFPDREMGERPRMTKRFSLSNMSSAFKKMAHGGISGVGSVPKVPDLPEMYRRPLEEVGIARRRSGDMSLAGKTIDIEARAGVMVKLEEELGRPLRATHSLDEALEIRPPVITATGPSDRTIVPIPRLARSESFSSLSSTATTAAHEQQTLISVSPRTQRDPSASLSLQNLISRGPAAEVVVVTRLTKRAMHARQQSLEATIVLNATPPPPLPRSRLMNREDSLSSISRSSSGCGTGSGSGQASSNESHTLKTPIAMPVSSMSLDEIRRHIPISQPRIGGFMDSQVELHSSPASNILGSLVLGRNIGSTESLHTLPSLGSEMIVVNSPTYTLASTSSGASASVSVKGKGKKSKPASASSKASTPRARSLVRMITSHARKSHQSQNTSISTVKASSPPSRPRTGKSGKSAHTPPPLVQRPIPSPSTRPQTNDIEGYDTLGQVVQLKSLHFEELDLDFNQLGWMQAAAN